MIPHHEATPADRTVVPPHRATGALLAPRVAICADVFSSNMGDGVIAESLEHLIRSRIPHAHFHRIDLSERDERPATSGDDAGPAEMHRVRQGLLSRWYRKGRLLLWWTVSLCRPPRRPLPPIDLFIMGGGQLLMDNELLFPVALDVARVRNSRTIRRIAVHACGVGDRWSTLGRWLVARVLADHRTIACSVRDDASQRNMARHFGPTSPHVDVAHDPALCAADVYGVTRIPASAAIGLGVMAPLTSYPGTDPDVTGRLSERRLMAFWHEVITRLHAAAYPVVLFTTGDSHDHAFATRIHGSLAKDLRDRITLAPKPVRPIELVATVAGFRAILAQRLHAHIIAYSLRVPSVGIIWDSKVEAFGVLTGRRTFFMNAESLSPEVAVDKIGEAIAAGVCPHRHAALQAGVRSSVSRLLERAGLLERAS